MAVRHSVFVIGSAGTGKSKVRFFSFCFMGKGSKCLVIYVKYGLLTFSTDPESSS